MKADHLLKNINGITNHRIKGIFSLFLITAMITPIIPVQADMKTGYGDIEAYWKHYPYYPLGTQISFPLDEGAHNDMESKIEWWYANFHLIGQTTEQEYGSVVAFYKIQSSLADKKEVRIFSISNIATEQNYTNAKIGTLTASTDHLDMNFAYITNEDKTDKQIVPGNEITTLISENQDMLDLKNTQTTIKSTNQNSMLDSIYFDIATKTNTMENCEIENQGYSDGLIKYDYWYTKSNEEGLLPFQYSLRVGGNSQQDDQPMELMVDMDCQKQPLIVGGDGIIYYGDYGLSYYYGLTRLLVTGTISVNGITEEVLGYAWIDHQWGNFIYQNPPPWGLTITYEWFSIQLNDNREIVVGDMWDRETGEKMAQSLTDGLNLINSDGSSELLNDYSITPLEFWNDITDERFYSCQWRLTETSKSINIVVTPVFQNQIMRFKENYQILQKVLEELFPGACFWEGVCNITGTINDIPVNGNAYVELTHYYDSVEK